MLEKIKSHLNQNFAFLKDKLLFVAVSGGIDSMVMLHLLKQLNYQIGVLHCNFNLRGKESNDDEKFVYNYSTSNKIYCVIGNFDTKMYAKQNNYSTQVAARNLRYDWFEEQLLEKKYDYVLTAHHLDDALETFIINLSRGTGLEGLTGIPKLNKKVVRPFLVFSRVEVEQYAAENKILWREDSSNETDMYLRNKIRHNLVPQLKDLNENFLNNFQKTQTYLTQSQNLVEDALDFAAGYAFEQVGEDLHFSIEFLKKLSDYKAYLYNYLKVIGFTAWDDIYDLVDAENGKKVSCKTHQIQKYREHLILSEIQDDVLSARFFINEMDKNIINPVALTIKKVTKITKKSKECIYLDYDKLIFPLEVRRFEPDDTFYPNGMNGSKKITKYLKDEQLTFTQRARTWLLVDATNTIIWVIGMRQDELFVVTENTKNILQITYSK